MAGEKQLTCDACGTENRKQAFYCRKCSRPLKIFSGPAERWRIGTIIVLTVAATMFSMAAVLERHASTSDMYAIVAQMAASAVFLVLAGFLASKRFARTARPTLRPLRGRVQLPRLMGLGSQIEDRNGLEPPTHAAPGDETPKGRIRSERMASVMTAFAITGGELSASTASHASG